ncbi:MAG: hypothetical protein ABIP41_04225 [Croceibacterium sp.]
MQIPRPALAFATACAAGLLLAGCNNSGGTAGDSTSQVVEGTIRDAMIPLDRLTSEPPVAEPTSVGASGAPSKNAPGKGDSKAAADTAAPAADTAAPTAASEAPAAASSE